MQDGQLLADGILRISRSNLRKVLVSHMPSDIVRWGTACTSAVPAANAGGKVQLGFADGSTTECDLLVVADGSSSKLRTSLLPHEPNNYAGVCMLMVS